MMLKMDTYLKWISAILSIYTILTTTTHSPPTVGKYEYRLRQFLKLGRRCIIVRGPN